MQLTRQIITDMIGDEEFYQTCPYFLHMRDLGLRCYNEYMQAMTSECEGCTRGKVLVPAIGAFVAQLMVLRTEQPTAIEQIKDYIGTRRPKRPQSLTLFHRSSKNNRVEQLRF